MIKIAMCDDEIKNISNVAKLIESILISINMDAEVICITENQDKIYKMIENHEIDILFLDIDFRKENQISGIDFATKLRKINKDFYLIFLTAHFEFVGIGYNCKTFRYITKPADRNIFEDCLTELKNDIEFNSGCFFKLNSNTLVRITDILYIEKSSMKATIYTSRESFTIYKSLDSLISSLPCNFLRCHKSYIVNLNKISSICLKDKTVLLLNNDKCPIGRKYIKSFTLGGNI